MDYWSRVDICFSFFSRCVGEKLDGYQKKKYVCKLLFIFLLGIDIDFGYQEAVNLLSTLRFSEKQIVSANLVLCTTVKGNCIVYCNYVRMYVGAKYIQGVGGLEGLVD